MGASHLHRVLRAPVDPFLARVVAALRDQDGVEEIRVFGSYIADKLNAASDVDIAVIVSAEAFVLRDLLRKRVSSAHTIEDPPFDLVFLPIEHFMARKDFGGLCYDVFHGGESLWRREDESV
jgi:predicted nucleotidyltransferase